MTIKWRRGAINNLARIRDYIADHNPTASQTVVERVLRSVDRLSIFHESDRPGQVPYTREIVVPGIPYTVVYADTGETAEIIAVFHAAHNRS